MPNELLNLSRNQIAAIVNNDPEAIRALENLLADNGGATWIRIDFTDSDLADIETRPHSALQLILGADETDSDTDKDKHVSNNQLKVAYDDIDANAANIAANLVSIKSQRVLHWLTM